MWLTLLALRNRIGILMLSLAMVVLGATSLNRLPRDLFPNIQVPVAFVGVIYKGAPPIDIEQSVVYPIEKAVSSASNVERVESFAKQGIGAVQVWFNWGADINVGQMEVMQRVTQILNQLPSGILQPFIGMFETSNLTMKGWRMPDGSWFRIWVTRCITSIWPTLMSAPQLNHTWTAPMPCLENDSTCSTFEAELTAFSMG